MFLGLSYNIHQKQSIAQVACAFEQGKFEEMHDVLFKNQNEWSNLN